MRNGECMQGRKEALMRKTPLKKEGERVPESKHEGMRMSDHEVSRKGVKA